MWRMWRMVDPRKAIIMTGLMIAFISTSIHLIQVSGERSQAFVACFAHPTQELVLTDFNPNHAH